MLAQQTQTPLQAAYRKIIAPLVAWIPDVSVLPQRNRAAIGAMASLLLHLLVFSGVIVSNLTIPSCSRRVLTPPPPLGQTELVPLPKKPLAIELVPLRTPLIDADGLTKSAKAPDKVDYESSQDMVAGAEKPATGLLNLPSQEGRTDLPGIQFAEQELRIGVAQNEPAPATPVKPVEKTQPSPPVAKPLFDPRPLDPPKIAEAATAKPTDELPEPAVPVKATPPPIKPVEKPSETTLAMLSATPAPKPLEREHPETFEPKLKAATPMPVQPKRPTITDQYEKSLRTQPATPPPPKESSFTPERVKTGVDAAINAPGKNGVNAKSSPMGRYRARMGQQIESLWNINRQGRLGDLASGTVRILVKLQETGRVDKIQVVDDGGSPNHTEICLRTIREMRPEKMPPEAAPLLENGILEITFSFTLY